MLRVLNVIKGKKHCRFREIDGAHSIKSRLLIKNEIDFLGGPGEKKADQQKNLCEFLLLLMMLRQ